MHLRDWKVTISIPNAPLDAVHEPHLEAIEAKLAELLWADENFRNLFTDKLNNALAALQLPL